MARGRLWLYFWRYLLISPNLARAVSRYVLWILRSFHNSFLLFGGVGGDCRGGEGLSMTELERLDGGELESDDMSVGSDIDCEVADDSYIHQLPLKTSSPR